MPLDISCTQRRPQGQPSGAVSGTCWPLIFIGVANRMRASGGTPWGTPGAIGTMRASGRRAASWALTMAGSWLAITSSVRAGGSSVVGGSGRGLAGTPDQEDDPGRGSREIARGRDEDGVVQAVLIGQQAQGLGDEDAEHAVHRHGQEGGEGTQLRREGLLVRGR